MYGLVSGIGLLVEAADRMSSSVVILPEAAWISLFEEAGWFGDLIGRIPDSDYKIFMTLLFSTALIYLALEILAVSGDLRHVVEAGRPSLSDRPPPLRRLVRFVTARPTLLYSAQKSTQSDWTEYLIVGRRQTTAPLFVNLWGGPLLGFLGTVAGLSHAIEALPGATVSGGDIAPVLASLHLAFDTTMLGILFSLVLYPGITSHEGRWDRLERAIEQFAEAATHPPHDRAENNR